MPLKADFNILLRGCNNVSSCSHRILFSLRLKGRHYLSFLSLLLSVPLSFLWVRGTTVNQICAGCPVIKSLIGISKLSTRLSVVSEWDATRPPSASQAISGCSQWTNILSSSEMTVFIPEGPEEVNSLRCWRFLTEEAKYWEIMRHVPASLVSKTDWSRHWFLLPNWIYKYINVLQKKLWKLIVERPSLHADATLITHEQRKFLWFIMCHLPGRFTPLNWLQNTYSIVNYLWVSG